ncbi:unnamed protein product, partial [Urochloa humidicola]
SLSLSPSCKWRRIAGLSAGSSGRPRRRVWPASPPTALQACATGLSPGGGGRRYPHSKAHGRQRSRAPPTSAIRAKQTENTLGDLVPFTNMCTTANGSLDKRLRYGAARGQRRQGWR